MLVLAALPFASVQMLGPGLAATTLPLCLLAGVLQMCTSQYKGATDSLTLGDVMAAMTTEPCESVYLRPLYMKSEPFFRSDSASPKPLKLT